MTIPRSQVYFLLPPIFLPPGFSSLNEVLFIWCCLEIDLWQVYTLSDPEERQTTSETRLFASLTRSPGLNERAPVEEAGPYIVSHRLTSDCLSTRHNHSSAYTIGTFVHLTKSLNLVPGLSPAWHNEIGNEVDNTASQLVS